MISQFEVRRGWDEQVFSFCTNNEWQMAGKLGKFQTKGIFQVACYWCGLRQDNFWLLTFLDTNVFLSLSAEIICWNILRRPSTPNGGWRRRIHLTGCKRSSVNKRASSAPYKYTREVKIQLVKNKMWRSLQEEIYSASSLIARTQGEEIVLVHMWRMSSILEKKRNWLWARTRHGLLTLARDVNQVRRETR